MKTRQQSNSERRNSVSDIADYFTKMAAEKTPAKTTSQTKNKEVKDCDKDKAKRSDSWDEQVSDNELVEAEKNGNPLNAEQTVEEEVATFNHAEALNTSNSEPNANLKTPLTTSKQTQTSEDTVLKELRELRANFSKLDNDLNDPKNGVAYQLAKQTTRIDGIYTDIHGAVSGLEVRMTAITDKTADNLKRIEKMEDNQKRITFMLNENKKLLQDLQTMKGIVQKISQKANVNASNLLDLTKRGMEQNIIIQGVDNTIEIEDAKAKEPIFKPKERCRHSALRFFKDVMRLDLQPEDIWKAHRTGAPKADKVRPLIIKLSYTAKELVMEHLGELKNKKNLKTDQVYFISEQIPEGITEIKKQTAMRLKDIKAENEKRPKEQRQHIQVINDKILLNGELDKPEITPPQPSDLFVDHKTQEAINQLQGKIQETEPVTVKNSQFIAMTLKVQSIQEINRAYIAVTQRFPAADHIMLAYAFKDEQGKLRHGGCDDREYGAAAKMKRVLFEEKAKNTAVFVLRDYGGVHLGFERFKTIEAVTRRALSLQ